MKYMRLAICTMCIVLMLGLSSDGFGRGGKDYSGGGGSTMDGPKGGGGHDTDGPLTDAGSTTGTLYGDLYKILRYQGGETKLVPRIDENGDPVFENIYWTDPEGLSGWIPQQLWDQAIAVGGEPILTEDFVLYQALVEGTTDQYEINEATGGTWFLSPTPSQCVQPIASYGRWGDLSSVENAENFPEYATIECNKIPLVMSYDATWDRTEFAVGTVDRPDFFISPGETWIDPKNGSVTYADGILWTDLIQEVSFGRLNQARAPEAVHQAAFDEAISSINAAVAIGVDASGRIVLTKEVYDEELVVTESTPIDPDYPEYNLVIGEPLFLGFVEKAIDSPLENLALYMKLMKDGHLVTPGDERGPIDRSKNGGIPLEMLLGLEDGPSTDLRPTVDIQKLRDWNLGHLVDVAEVTYYTYIEEVMEGGTVVDLVVRAVTNLSEIPANTEYETWVGIPTNDGSSAEDPDFEFCSSFLAAAADKTGKISVDKVVYLNSIMGLNKVVGMSEDGNIDYSKTPQYYNYGAMNPYNRPLVFNTRGYYEYDPSNPGGDPIFVQGEVVVLQNPTGTGGDPIEGVWEEFSVGIVDSVPFEEWGESVDRLPNGETATFNIGGFAQATDDDLGVIEFVHTYQIPENR